MHGPELWDGVAWVIRGKGEGNEVCFKIQSINLTVVDSIQHYSRT